MLVLRAVGFLALLFLLALGLAFLVTRDRKYLRIALTTIQALVLLGAAFGLLYVFGRVLRFL